MDLLSNADSPRTRRPQSGTIPVMDTLAIIRIHNGKVHLEASFNSSAAEPIQLEENGSDGWWLCQHCPGLRYAFWSMWCEWNGHMCGGIYLTDGLSEGDVEEILAPFQTTYSPDDIASLPDGTWLVDGAVAISGD